MDDLETRDRDIGRLYIDEELSLLQLGKMYGLTKERVRQVLDRSGVERRGRGRPPGPVAEERRERHAAFANSATIRYADASKLGGKSPQKST